jgi:hypothetical protein
MNYVLLNPFNVLKSFNIVGYLLPNNWDKFAVIAPLFVTLLTNILDYSKYTSDDPFFVYII